MRSNLLGLAQRTVRKALVWEKSCHSASDPISVVSRLIGYLQLQVLPMRGMLVALYGKGD